MVASYGPQRDLPPAYGALLAASREAAYVRVAVAR